MLTEACSGRTALRARLRRQAPPHGTEDLALEPERLGCFFGGCLFRTAGVAKPPRRFWERSGPPQQRLQRRFDPATRPAQLHQIVSLAESNTVPRMESLQNLLHRLLRMKRNAARKRRIGTHFVLRGFRIPAGPRQPCPHLGHSGRIMRHGGVSLRAEPLPAKRRADVSCCRIGLRSRPGRRPPRRSPEALQRPGGCGAVPAAHHPARSVAGQNRCPALPPGNRTEKADAIRPAGSRQTADNFGQRRIADSRRTRARDFSHGFLCIPPPAAGPARTRPLRRARRAASTAGVWP